MAPETWDLLSEFDLSELTRHYIMQELYRCDVDKFFKEIANIRNRSDFNPPPFWEGLRELSDLNWISARVKDCEELGIVLVLALREFSERESLNYLNHFFELTKTGKKSEDNITKLGAFLTGLKQFDMQEVCSDLDQENPKACFEKTWFQFLFRYKRITPFVEKHRDLLSLEIGNVDDFLKLKLCEQQGKEIFQDRFAGEQAEEKDRGNLRLLAHLLAVRPSF